MRAGRPPHQERTGGYVIGFEVAGDFGGAATHRGGCDLFLVPQFVFPHFNWTSSGGDDDHQWPPTLSRA